VLRSPGADRVSPPLAVSAAPTVVQPLGLPAAASVNDRVGKGWEDMQVRGIGSCGCAFFGIAETRLIFLV